MHGKKANTHGMINGLRGIGIACAASQGFQSHAFGCEGVLPASFQSSFALGLGGNHAATGSYTANALIYHDFVLHHGCILCQNGYARLLGGTIHLLARAEAVPSTNLLVLT